MSEKSGWILVPLGGRVPLNGEGLPQASGVEAANCILSLSPFFC